MRRARCAVALAIGSALSLRTVVIMFSMHGGLDRFGVVRWWWSMTKRADIGQGQRHEAFTQDITMALGLMNVFCLKGLFTRTGITMHQSI